MDQQNERTQQAEQTPDTFFDPARTTFWTADSESGGHVVQKIELPDNEEEKEHSKPIAFLNAILFLIMLAAFLFCFFETGFLRYLLH